MNPMLAVVLVLAYLIGAIPFSVIVGKRLRGVDVQRTGSGNAGAMNTFRSVGRSAGVLVALLDALKGAAAMLLGRLVIGPEAAALCGAVAVAGHCFSPYLIYAARHDRSGGWKRSLRRTGGKGLASGMAVLLLIDWRLAVITLVVFFTGMLILRKDETWPTLVAVILTPPLVWWLTGNLILTFAVLVVGTVVIIKHLPDVRSGFYVSATTDDGRRTKQQS